MERVHATVSPFALSPFERETVPRKLLDTNVCGGPIFTLSKKDISDVLEYAVWSQEPDILESVLQEEESFVSLLASDMSIRTGPENVKEIRGTGHSIQKSTDYSRKRYDGGVIRKWAGISKKDEVSVLKRYDGGAVFHICDKIKKARFRAAHILESRIEPYDPVIMKMWGW